MSHPREYVYSTLSELFETSDDKRKDDKVNLYGVICSPVEVDPNDTTHHYIQITDDSLNTGANSPRAVYLSIYSLASACTSAETTFCVGRVIRVHRCFVKVRTPDLVCVEGRVRDSSKTTSKGMLSWIVFDSESNKVIASSSEHFTPSKEDETRVPQLIEWVNSQKVPPVQPPQKKTTTTTPTVVTPTVVTPPAVTPRKKSRSSTAEVQPVKATVPDPKTLSGNSSSSPTVRLAQINPSNSIFSCVVYVCNSLFPNLLYF